jgi:hypothetical protein
MTFSYWNSPTQKNHQEISNWFNPTPLLFELQSDWKSLRSLKRRAPSIRLLKPQGTIPRDFKPNGITLQGIFQLISDSGDVQPTIVCNFVRIGTHLAAVITDENVIKFVLDETAVE